MQTAILKHVTLIDGNGGKPRQDVTLIINNNLIEAIMEDNNTDLPMAAEILDLTGCYVVPGLIDAHVHMATDPSLTDARPIVESRLRHALYGGVTTVRDMAGDCRTLSELSRCTVLDEIESPDLYYASLVAGPSFFSDPRTKLAANGLTPGKVPWMLEITPETDVPEAVTLAKGTFASAIKIYADLDAVQIERVTKEAHRQDMKVWAHASLPPTRPSAVIDAGVDTVSHANLLGLEAMETLPGSFAKLRKEKQKDSFFPDDSCFKLLFQKMIDNQVIFDPTLLYNLLFINERVDLSCKIIRMAHDAGVRIAAGTDYIGSPEDGLFPQLLLELELLVDHCGFTPLEAITSATNIGARAIGIEMTHGTLEVGKRANLIVLQDNPAADIRHLKKILFVMKNGKVYNRSFYSPSPIKEIKRKKPYQRDPDD